MIGNIVTDTKTGKPLDGNGKKLSVSAYQPTDDVKKLWNRCQTDYGIAWRLQHRAFDEFDGISLLQRAKVDQGTFGAFVGAQWLPKQKQWRWKGRKNTARNKLIGILAHMLQGMLYPLVHAVNQEDEPDKMTARVMRILIEEYLRKADYEMNFLYMVLSALVNPAVLVEVSYVTAMQRIKERLANGEIQVTQAIDELLTGLALNIIPIDQLLLSDFYVRPLQKQSYLVRIDRISWDQARKIYAGRYVVDGTDQFDYVEAGKTRILLSGQEHLTLYDIEWTEADRNAVQVATFYYRDEDLQVTFVGGVFMGNQKDIYNNNPFEHRRMSLLDNEWHSIPIYPFAKSGFEPIDPTGRFAYYKSGAFKEYWDDATQNKMHQLLVDGTYLDVIKPMFISGLAQANSNVIAPGAVIGMPPGSTVSPFAMGPNLVGAMNAMKLQQEDMSESTQDASQSGVQTPGVSATQTIQAQNQARVIMGPFAFMIADLVGQIGYLVKDCIIQHVCAGELDATVPESLDLKFKTILAKGKEKGKDITNRVVFTSAMMGKKYTPDQIRNKEWDLWKQGGEDQRIYHVNPYQFARTTYSFYVDPDDIADSSMGNNRQRKLLAFQMFSNPLVAPYVDMKNVVDDFIIEEFSDGDPERYQAKGNVNAMMGAVMGQGGQQGGGQGGQGGPPQPPNPMMPPKVGLPANQGM